MTSGKAGAMVMMVAFLVAGCIDRVYGHIITGHVLDAAGAPIPDARVCRVWEAGVPDDLDAAIALPHLYCTMADAEGIFAFVYSGHGPKPTSSETWHIVAVHEGHPSGAITVEAHWLDACLAYVAVDVEIRAIAAPRSIPRRRARRD